MSRVSRASMTGSSASSSAGHLVLATSGSSGKCSFLNATRDDFELKRRHFAHTLGFPWFSHRRDRVVFMLGPSNGPNSAVEASRIGAEVWGRPDAIHFLTDEPLRISEVSAMAAMRKRMQDGLATPQEIADFEARTASSGSADATGDAGARATRSSRTATSRWR